LVVVNYALEKDLSEEADVMKTNSEPKGYKFQYFVKFDLLYGLWNDSITAGCFTARFKEHPEKQVYGKHAFGTNGNSLRYACYNIKTQPKTQTLIDCFSMLLNIKRLFSGDQQIQQLMLQSSSIFVLHTVNE